MYTITIMYVCVCTIHYYYVCNTTTTMYVCMYVYYGCVAHSLSSPCVSSHCTVCVCVCYCRHTTILWMCVCMYTTATLSVRMYVCTSAAVSMCVLL